MFKPVEANPNFPEMEKKILEKWEKEKIVERYLKKNSKSEKRFSFQDGPITANNPMGIHHAWGRTYKDIWQRFFNLLGYRERFQNGFDCQGLWVEVEVEKELKLKNKKEIENLVPGDPKASVAKFVQLCKDRVYKYSGIQTEQSRRLAYFMDWEHSYFTMSDENNYMIWRFLKKCHENGWIYKGHESVPWCPRCETAISQHEMLTEDYKEIVHESVFVKFPISNFQFPNKHQITNPNTQIQYLLVWTTTPWTIPANIAVAVDKKLDYSLVEYNQENFWVAKDLVRPVFGNGYKVIKTVKGMKLVGLKYEGPFDEIRGVKTVAGKNPKTFHTVIPTDDQIMPISISEGTGLVHTAVSAGTEDFQLGKKLGLPMIPVIADNADYLPGLDFLSGKNAKKHPEIIIDYLKRKNNGDFLFKTLRYKHRYPACWRCKSELVWKVADEWYISMDKPSQIPISKFQFPNKSQIRNSNKQTLRGRMIEVTKKIKWLPEFGLDRELDWLKNMHDWLISKKNRYWGLALPIYECGKCHEFEIIGSKEELKERAVEGWSEFEGRSPHKPFIDEIKIKCKKCGSLTKRIADVGNPWLDAGIVEYSTIAENNQGEPLYTKNKKGWEKWVPVDFITESFPGQFKNWFYAQIAMSSVMENIQPFKTVLGFATMFGEDGRPMHKSWGNYIEFNDGAEKIGVDVMRWLFSRQDPSENLLFGFKKTDEVRRQFYLILWNIYKFFVEYATLEKFQIPCPQMLRIKRCRRANSNFQTNHKSQITNSKNILDEWIIGRLNWLMGFIEKSLKNYNVKEAALEAEKFVNDLSTWYIRRSRERVWVNSEDKEDKNNFYQTLYSVLVNLAIVLSPFIPFVTDEIFTNLTGEASVHLGNWPSTDKKIDESLLADMQLIREIVETGHRIRKEEKLKVKQPLAGAKILLPKAKVFASKDNLNQYLRLIEAELNVKKISLETGRDESIAVTYDTHLTRDLIHEGKLRELVRQIQGERKRLGKDSTAVIKLTVTDEFAGDIDYLKKRVMAEEVSLGVELKVE